MSEKTLKFDNIIVNKREFHKSKQLNLSNLESVNTDQIVVYDNLKHSDDGFKYFLGYKEGEIAKPLCIILPQMSGYIKYFKNARKNMPFMVKDNAVLGKYEDIWDEIGNTLTIEFHSMRVYDEKHIKAKVKEFDGKINTNFLGNKIPKENKHYTCIACLTIDSVMRIEKKNYLQVFVEECKYRVKKTKMTKFIYAKLETDSESEPESEPDIKLMTKLESNSDSE